MVEEQKCLSGGFTPGIMIHYSEKKESTNMRVRIIEPLIPGTGNVEYATSSTGNRGNSKISSAFDKFRQIEQSQPTAAPLPTSSDAASSSSRLTRQASMPSVKRSITATPTGSAPPPPSSSTYSSPHHLGGGSTTGFAGVGRPVQRSHTTYGIGSSSASSGQADKPRVMVRSASSAKEIVLTWVQDKVNTYPEDKVHVTNFSTCWNDGMAFCALIHYFYPEAFDFTSLDPANRRYNFTLAFDTAEKYADICPLLEVDDMVRMKKPDWKCVFTYVQSFYRRFRNGRDLPTAPPQRSKTIAVGAHEAREISSKLTLQPNIQESSQDESGGINLEESSSATFTETVFGQCPDQALSADHQKRLLSKYCFDDDDDGFSGLRSTKGKTKVKLW